MQQHANTEHSKLGSIVRSHQMQILRTISIWSIWKSFFAKKGCEAKDKVLVNTAEAITPLQLWSMRREIYRSWKIWTLVNLRIVNVQRLPLPLQRSLCPGFLIYLCLHPISHSNCLAAVWETAGRLVPAKVLVVIFLLLGSEIQNSISPCLKLNGKWLWSSLSSWTPPSGSTSVRSTGPGMMVTLFCFLRQIHHHD